MVVRYAKAQEAARGAVKQYFGGKVGCISRVSGVPTGIGRPPNMKRRSTIR